jgi:hypothetical protein
MVSQNEHKDLSKFLQLKHQIGDVRPNIVIASCLSIIPPVM